MAGPGFGPLLEELAAGRLDGVYTTHENRTLLVDHPLASQIDAELLPAPQGFLLFLKDRYALYGYRSLSDFAYDCQRGMIEAKTIAGALSLGPCRRISGEALEVVLSGSGLATWPRFWAATPVEASEIELQLKKLYPQGMVLIKKKRALSIFIPPLGAVSSLRVWRFFLWDGPPLVRRAFGWMLATTALLFFFVTLTWISRWPFSLVAVTIGLFFWSFFRFVRTVNEQGPFTVLEAAPTTSVPKGPGPMDRLLGTRKG